MPPQDPRTWQEVAASNRERITALERESDRQRESVHALRGEVQAVRYLGEKISDLAADVRELAERVERVTRQAVQRPSQTSLQVLGQYLALIVAIIALVIAARG